MSEYNKDKSLEEVRRELKLLMDSIPGGVCRLRYDDGLLLEYANEGMFSLMKVSSEEFKRDYDNHYERLLNAEDWVKLRAKIENSIQYGGVIQMEYTVHYESRDKDEWRLMQAVIFHDGTCPVLQCVITDVTEQRETYAQLEQEKKKLHIIAKMCGDMLFEYNIEKDFMDYTRQGEGLVNAKQFTENYTEVISTRGTIHPEDADILKQFCTELRMGKKHIYVQLRKMYQDGMWHWIEIEGVTLNDLTGNPARVIGRTKNIDDRKEEEERYRYYAERDSLTGLYKYQVVISKMRNRKRYMRQEQNGWLVIIDLDNFKEFNEKNGNVAGDAVLGMIADKLKITFNGGLIGRLGGDKFIACIEGSSEENVEKKLDTLNKVVRNLYKDDEGKGTVSCSIGAAQCINSTDSFDKIFAWAEYALYRVKQGKKDGYCILNAEGEAPDVGYLEKTANEEFNREETTIGSGEELVMFIVELLDSVSDLQSGLRLVSDRICCFYDVEDVAFITRDNDSYVKKFHWNRQAKRELGKAYLSEIQGAWQYMEDNYDSRGCLIFRKDKLNVIPGLQLGSVLFVKPEKALGKECAITFIDRKNDRSWDKEKENLARLSNIIFNHVHHVNEKNRILGEAERKINYDSVTGLLVYQKFIEEADRYVKAHNENDCYYVYSDFSHFQYLNEMYGYTEGDKILRLFAERLKKFTYGICFTHVSSDHFAGLLTGAEEEEIRQAYLEMTEDFCQQVNRQHVQCNLVMVSGLSGILHAEEAPSLAVDRANVARKYGKNTVNTTVLAYNREIKEKNETEKEIIASMVPALENGEFKAWLQPKISLATGRITGAEALVRWQKADGSRVFPDSFIPLFEKNGFITNLDFAVLDQVLAYLRDAMDCGEQVVPVSVNFSRCHNANPDFVDMVLQKLSVMNIPTEYIEAELTESIFVQDFDTLTDNLRKFRENGVKISIDDFGSGYSSLNVLANMEADVIKLDREFLSSAMQDDAKTTVFIKNLVKMIKCMGYKVLAEGVETEEQLALLRDTECDMVQGYFYARPMPITDFRAFLKEFNK